MIDPSPVQIINKTSLRGPTSDTSIDITLIISNVPITKQLISRTVSMLILKQWVEVTKTAD